MSLEPPPPVVERFFSGTGTSYDRIVAAGTLGLDAWWKRALLSCLPPGPRAVLDQASGTGILTFEIARRFPSCRVVGVELRREYVALAEQRRVRQGLANVAFVQGRAEDVRLRLPLDAVTSSYLAKYAEIDALVANAREMLRPGGRFLAHDFAYPRMPPVAAAWEVYFGALRAVGLRTNPEWREVFLGLPELLRETAWVDELAAALGRHGFHEVRIRSLTLGAAALVTATAP